MSGITVFHRPCASFTCRYGGSNPQHGAIVRRGVAKIELERVLSADAGVVALEPVHVAAITVEERFPHVPPTVIARAHRVHAPSRAEQTELGERRALPPVVAEDLRGCRMIHRHQAHLVKI
jgi:hypothetical protein